MASGGAEAWEPARCWRHQRGVLSCSHPMRALNATWATCMARAGPGGLPKRERLEHGGGQRDDHSAQHCSQRLPAGWRPLRARTTVSRAVCATLVAVGLEVTVPAHSLTQTAIFVPGRAVAEVRGCTLLPASQLPQPNNRPPPMADPTQAYRGTAPPNVGWVSLVDSVIRFAHSRAMPSVAVRTYTSISIENTWVTGKAIIVAFAGTVEAVDDVLAPTTEEETGLWTHVQNVAVGVRTDPDRWKPR